MGQTSLEQAVYKVVEDWAVSKSLHEQVQALAKPAELSQLLGRQVEGELVSRGELVGTLRTKILDSPYTHLHKAFSPSNLPDSPEAFFPVPDVSGTVAGRVAVLAILGFLSFEAVSYGTENNGELFVSLVPIPGTGKMSEKSTKGMRGHTDGVSFPFNGDVDGSNFRIAPSPDFVILVGLRNPHSIATTVMPLDLILSELSSLDIEELKKPQYSIRSQATFIQGMKSFLNQEHIAMDVPVLKAVPKGSHVRYSHSSVVSTVAGGGAEAAANSFESVCDRVAQSVVIDAGDIVIVSNRLCLHGRRQVGAGVGGNSRWLLRTYGLDTSNLDANKRRTDIGADHILYP